MPQTPCPYCGQPHESSDAGRCTHCNGLFEPLSQIATQLAMGPWYVRDEDRPFMPGFNESILRQQVKAGRITANTIVRGPTTNQFWTNAADAPGVSRLMGTCHSCHQAVEPTDTTCQFCKSDMSLPDDVDALGLRYTTDEARAEAQREMAEGRANPPAPKPTAKPTPPPAPAPVKQTQAAAPTPVKPADTQPVPAAAPVEEEHGAHEDSHDLTSELAEDVWHAGPAPSRRRKRKKGADPLVLGMGVVLLCVVAVGGFILLTSGTQPADNPEEEEDVAETVIERDTVSVSRISVPALAVYERLVPEEIPEAFADRYEAIKRVKQRAEIAKEAERFNEAYDAYEELGKLVTPLEDDIAQWQLDQQAKADASAQRDSAVATKEKAQSAQAERWAVKEWQDAEATWGEAEQRFTAGDFAEASELYAQAESSYLSSENKALAGQAANQARSALNEAVQANSSDNSLRTFANDQIEAMLALRSEGDSQLNDQQYAQAEQSYTSALDALNEAKQIAEMARYRKYYAFEAGYQASALMLSAARGDGVDSTAQSALKTLFDKLRILPNPAAGITPGDDVGFTVAIQPLVNDARDAIIKQHGEPVQACYLIGFHASIIEETLKTIALTDDQQKRVHQSLGTIERSAEEAGWDMNKLRPVIEQVRTLNRNAKLNEVPDATRAAWKRLLSPMQSRENAPRLMDPVEGPDDPSDPELFPTRG